MVRINKNKNILKTCVSVVKSMFKTAIEVLIAEANKISIIAQICIPVIIAQMPDTLTMLIISASLILLVNIVRSVRAELVLETKSGIPIMQKRYVKRDSDGFLVFEDMADYPELLQYTYSLQQYFDSKGMIEDGNESAL